jgi:hypothetical protein
LLMNDGCLEGERDFAAVPDGFPLLVSTAYVYF